MTGISQVRKAALSLPETVEESHAATVSFTVRGKRFASVTRTVVQLHLSAADADRVLDDHSTAERVTRGATRLGVVRVQLEDIDGQQMNHWVRRAWLARAPKRLAAEVSAGDHATAGRVGDLPKGIGKPATQALVGAGITTLAQVAGHSKKDLLTLHGIGPRAVRILDEALERQGQSMRD